MEVRENVEFIRSMIAGLSFTAEYYSLRKRMRDMFRKDITILSRFPKLYNHIQNTEGGLREKSEFEGAIVVFEIC